MDNVRIKGILTKVCVNFNSYYMIQYTVTGGCENAVRVPIVTFQSLMAVMDNTTRELNEPGQVGTRSY